MNGKFMVLISCFFIAGCVTVGVINNSLTYRAQEGIFKSYEEALEGYNDGDTLIVVLGAEWCGPCKIYKNRISKTKWIGCQFTYIDVDKDPERARSFEVDYSLIPTTIIYHPNKQKGVFVGPVFNNELKRKIEDVRK